jgi:CRISPR type IV-associated protein Csf3
MTPLRVHAALDGPVVIPDGGLYLDSLLIAQVARERDLVCLDATMLVPLDIPITMDPDGRFYLCSSGQSVEIEAEMQHTVRRPIVAEAQALAETKLRRLDITTGANRAYYMPRPVGYLDSGIVWWCMGEADEIRRLLSSVTNLGKRRAVGLGRVDAWTVEPCDPWPGFPVVRDGKPLRRLPIGWPGVEEARCGFGTIAPPYWDQTKEEPCLLP